MRLPRPSRSGVTRWCLVAVLALLVLGAAPPPAAPRVSALANQPVSAVAPAPASADRPGSGPASSSSSSAPAKGAVLGAPEEVLRSLKTVAPFALLTFAPAAVLMVTAFVRINIVLLLLRQALGSPQIPGNQVLTALALLLTALVMRPVAESVYTRAIQPYANHCATAGQAWDAGTKPIKAFMIQQIVRTHHEDYVWQLYDLAHPSSRSPGHVDPTYEDEFPLEVVAPAFLLSELTSALVIGFYIYLPFLVIDLVVSAVLAAMGLIMLPPSLIALPLKLILFVLADGWLLVATMLLQSFNG